MAHFLKKKLPSLNAFSLEVDLMTWYRLKLNSITTEKAAEGQLQSTASALLSFSLLIEPVLWNN